MRRRDGAAILVQDFLVLCLDVVRIDPEKFNDLVILLDKICGHSDLPLHKFASNVLDRQPLGESLNVAISADKDDLLPKNVFHQIQPEFLAKWEILHYLQCPS
ncbi:MAG: hypothetical protein WA639_17925 [Candidatus Acidiferrum sp.]